MLQGDSGGPLWVREDEGGEKVAYLVGTLVQKEVGAPRSILSPGQNICFFYMQLNKTSTTIM